MSDHLLHLAARAMGVSPLRPRVRLRFEPDAESATTGAPALEATEPERGAADGDPLATSVSSGRVAFARPDAAADAPRASLRENRNHRADEALGERTPSERASRRREHPIEATRGGDSDGESVRRSPTDDEQSAAPALRSRRDESDVATIARRDTGSSVGRTLQRPSDDLADSALPVAPHRSASASGHRAGTGVTSAEPASKDATPSAERRHRFDVRSPREAMLADSVARRDQDMRSNEHGRGDVWTRDAAHARRPHAADRTTRPAEPVVHVSIGRIEVRATTPAAPPRAAERRHSPMTIDDYVARGRAR